MNAHAIPNFESKTKTGITFSLSNMKVNRSPPRAAVTNETMNALFIPTPFTISPLIKLAVISEAHETDVLTKMLPGIYFMKNVIK